MKDEYYTYVDIPKRTRNAMKKRIESAVRKYGFEVFRKCTLKYINEVNQRTKLQQDIEKKERELLELKNSS